MEMLMKASIGEVSEMSKGLTDNQEIMNTLYPLRMYVSEMQV